MAVQGPAVQGRACRCARVPRGAIAPPPAASQQRVFKRVSELSATGEEPFAGSWSAAKRTSRARRRGRDASQPGDDQVPWWQRHPTFPSSSIADPVKDSPISTLDVPELADLFETSAPAPHLSSLNTALENLLRDPDEVTPAMAARLANGVLHVPKLADLVHNHPTTVYMLRRLLAAAALHPGSFKSSNALAQLAAAQTNLQLTCDTFWREVVDVPPNIITPNVVALVLRAWTATPSERRADDTEEWLYKLAKDSVPGMGPSAICIALRAITQLGLPVTHGLAIDLASAVPSRAAHMEPALLVDILEMLTTTYASVLDGAAWSMLQHALVVQLRALDAPLLASALMSCERAMLLGYPGSYSMKSTVASALSPVLARASAELVCRAFRGAARVGATMPPTLFTRLCKALERVRDNLTPSSVEDLLYGFAALPRSATARKRVVLCVREAVADVAIHMSAPQLVLGMTATMYLAPPPSTDFRDAVLGSLRRVAALLPPADAAGATAAAGWLGAKDPRLQRLRRSLTEAVHHGLPVMDAPAVSRVVRGFAELSIRPVPGATRQVLEETLVRTVPQMRASEVAWTLWGMAQLAIRPRVEVLDVMSDAVLNTGVDMTLTESQVALWGSKWLMDSEADIPPEAMGVPHVRDLPYRFEKPKRQDKLLPPWERYM